jgi:uncharacterized membrane protein
LRICGRRIGAVKAPVSRDGAGPPAMQVEQNRGSGVCGESLEENVMSLENPKSTVEIAGHPIHPMLIPFPIAFFVGAFAADLAFWRTGDGFFANGALWLIGAGLVMAALAALAGLTDFLSSGAIRALRPAWLHMIGNVTAVVIELVSFLLRFRDPVASVMPTGLILSLVVTLILLFTGWMGWEMVYKDHVAIAES